MAELNRRSTAATAIRRIVAQVGNAEFSKDEHGLQQELASLKLHFERFMAAHDVLIMAAQPGELDSHTQLWDEIEEHYNNAMAQLQRLLAAVPSKPDGENLEETLSSRLIHPTTMDLKLDPLALPKFDGTLHNWLAFKDTFETLVHSQDFPEAYKLGKLREAVKGDAVALVGGLYTGGYEDVWKALKLRYDSPKQLAEIHVSRFIGLQQLSTETTSSLLSIVDTVRESFRALQVMKLPVQSWDALAVPIITSKLPTSTRQAWGMSQTSNEIPKLDDLLAFVERRAHSLATEGLRWNATDGNRRPSMAMARGSTPLNRPSRLMKSNLASTAPGNCEFCDSKIHRISNCSKLLMLPVAERFRKLRGSNLCFNCLKPGHATQGCSSGNCRNCQGRHHTLLCRRNTSGTTPLANPMAKSAPTTTSATVPSSSTNTNPPPCNYPA